MACYRGHKNTSGQGVEGSRVQVKCESRNRKNVEVLLTSFENDRLNP